MAIIISMPLIAKVPLALKMHQAGGYNNRHPRSQQQQLEGLGARAYAAHQNCFEAICYFAPTILLVLALDEQDLYTAQLCVAFVVLRILYLFCYWADWHVARSSIWVIAMATLVPHYWLLF